MTNTTETPTFDEPAVAIDFDVDAPAASDAEDAPAAPIEGAKADEKTAKEPKNTRPPVPEGKVSPVQFAKNLTEHLRKEHPTLGVRKGENESVAPQVVYSYIKNNAAGSKNPFPAVSAEGRAAVVDNDAALAWWDEKDLRVKAGKDAKAAAAAAKAEKASKGETAVTDTPAEAVEVTEAE